VVTWEERLARKPPAVHPKWDGILARCLDPDPLRRFRDADEVAKALAPRSRRWLWAAGVAAMLAIVTGVVTYERATAPKESVRLAMQRFDSDRDTSAIADGLFRDTAAQLKRLRGNARTSLSITTLPVATHVLHGTLSKKNDKVMVHAYLTDAHSRVNAREWKVEYAPGEVRYVPVALAAMVTGTLRLPPLATAARVNDAARKDYLSGLSYVRRDSGVDVALAFMERAVAADPDSALTYAGLAEAQWFKYFLTKDKVWLDRATESEREAERRDPDLAAMHRVAGMLKANAGRYEQAEAEYRRAIELEPGNSDAYRRLGMVLEQNNQSEEALAAYRRALEVEPNYYRTYQALGSFYYNRANYSEAVKYLSKEIELAPDEVDAHRALGSALTFLGRFSDAESDLRFAIRLRETPTALNALGLTLMYQGRDNEAIPQFLSALKVNPESYFSGMELGNCYRRTNQTAEAIRAYRRALELAEQEMSRNPRSGYVRSILAYLCARLGDRDRAASEIAQALQLSSNGADTQATAAFTYEALSMRDATISVLSSAPADLLADLSRWPDVADLHNDPRFLQLLASHQLR
jgi:Flp pilus assembly protein TadD